MKALLCKDEKTKLLEEELNCPNCGSISRPYINWLKGGVA